MPSSAINPPRIAVVDDEESLHSLLHEVFTDRGWQLLPLLDGAMALTAIKTERPDIVLLDIWLEGSVTGWQILEELKADPGTDGIPVVVWSGAIDYLREKRGWLAERGIPVLEKPFEIDDLYQVLDLALEDAMKTAQPR